MQPNRRPKPERQQQDHLLTPLQVLAASLANLGKQEKAATCIEEILKNEPQFSLSRLRSRLMFMDERVWDDFSKGLLLAGLLE